MYLDTHAQVTVSESIADYSLITVTVHVHSVLYVTHPMNSFWYVLFILTSFGMYSASSLWQSSTGRSGRYSNLTGVGCLRRGVFESIRATQRQVTGKFVTHRSTHVCTYAHTKTENSVLDTVAEVGTRIVTKISSVMLSLPHQAKHNGCKQYQVKTSCPMNIEHKPTWR